MTRIAGEVSRLDAVYKEPRLFAERESTGESYVVTCSRPSNSELSTAGLKSASLKSASL